MLFAEEAPWRGSELGKTVASLRSALRLSYSNLRAISSLTGDERHPQRSLVGVVRERSALAGI